MDKKVEWVTRAGSKMSVYLQGDVVVLAQYAWTGSCEPIVFICEDRIETPTTKYFARGRDSVQHFNYLYETYLKLIAELVAREYGGVQAQAFESKYF